MPLDLKTALAQRRKAAEAGLRVDVCLDRDLVEEFEALQAERAQISAPFEQRRNQLSNRTGGYSDLRLSDNPHTIASTISAEESAATADIDARITEVKQRGAANTVQIVFAVLAPTQYQEIVNRHIAGDKFDAVAFTRDLVATAFRGVEQDGEPLEATWDEIATALNYGEVDAISNQVLLANRGTVAAPFSRKSSATNP
jgi:hypothetical protein